LNFVTVRRAEMIDNQIGGRVVRSRFLKN